MTLLCVRLKVVDHRTTYQMQCNLRFRAFKYAGTEVFFPTLLNGNCSYECAKVN